MWLAQGREDDGKVKGYAPWFEAEEIVSAGRALVYKG